MSHTAVRMPIEHVVVASNRPYQQVIEALEARLGPPIDLQAIAPQPTSWEQFEQAITAHTGPSGLMLFFKAEHSYLPLLGKNSRATQYTIGNALLASRMTRYAPEIALYAPLKLVVYQDEAGRTSVAYDSFVSLLVQYRNEEITRTAKQVEQKLVALVAEVTLTSL
jgi:hypothetical protein